MFDQGEKKKASGGCLARGLGAKDQLLWAIPLNERQCCRTVCLSWKYTFATNRIECLHFTNQRSNILDLCGKHPTSTQIRGTWNGGGYKETLLLFFQLFILFLWIYTVRVLSLSFWCLHSDTWMQILTVHYSAEVHFYEFIHFKLFFFIDKTFHLYKLKSSSHWNKPQCS